MSDPTIPMLKRIQEVFESKREAIDAVITHVMQTIALLEDDSLPAVKAALPAHEPKVRKVRAAKSEKSRPAAKAKAGKGGLPPYTREDVVNIAIEVIRREGGPVTSRQITKEVYARHSKTGTLPASHLAYEIHRASKPRLVRTKDGLYAWNTTAKAVDVKRSPEEVEKALARARANAERPITDEVRA